MRARIPILAAAVTAALFALTAVTLPGSASAQEPDAHGLEEDAEVAREALRDHVIELYKHADVPARALDTTLGFRDPVTALRRIELLTRLAEQGDTDVADLADLLREADARYRAARDAVAP